MDPPSTGAVSQGAITRNLVDFRDHEQATRVEFEIGSIRSEPHVLGGSDTKSIAGISGQRDGVEVTQPLQKRLILNRGPPILALASLDGVTLRDVSDTRAVVMHSVPFFLRGAFKGALKVFFQAIIRGCEKHSDLRISRGWKLFMLFTRLMLFRRRR